MYCAVGLPGRTPGMKPPFLRRLSASVDRVEDERRVEVREEDDEHREQDDVDPAACERAVANSLQPGDVRKNCAIVAGKSRSDDAKMIGMTFAPLTFSGMYVPDAAVHLAADDALRVLHRDAALRRLHEDDRRDDEQRDREHQRA